MNNLHVKWIKTRKGRSKFPNTPHRPLQVLGPVHTERNHSTSFRIVPKSGTLNGCVHTGTLQIELFCSKNWKDQKSDAKNGAMQNRSVTFQSEQTNGKHVNGTIAFLSEQKTKLVHNHSVPVWAAYFSIPEIRTKMERNDCVSVWTST